MEHSSGKIFLLTCTAGAMVPIYDTGIVRMEDTEIFVGGFCMGGAEVGESFRCCRAMAVGINYMFFRRRNITAARK
eukprot:4628065-Ditylum_brightwellii.AAC.1